MATIPPGRRLRALGRSFVWVLPHENDLRTGLLARGRDAAPPPPIQFFWHEDFNRTELRALMEMHLGASITGLSDGDAIQAISRQAELGRFVILPDPTPGLTRPAVPEQKPKPVKIMDHPAETTSWLEITLVDPDGDPVPNIAYQVLRPNGQVVRSGALDSRGYALVDGIEPGAYQVTFPALDQDGWQLQQ